MSLELRRVAVLPDAGDSCGFSGDGRYLVVRHGAMVRSYDLDEVDEQQPRLVASFDGATLAGPLPGPNVAVADVDSLRFVHAGSGEPTRTIPLPAFDDGNPPVMGSFRLATARVVPGTDQLIASIDGPLDMLPCSSVCRFEFGDDRWQRLGSSIVARRIAVASDGSVAICGEEPRMCGNAPRRGEVFTVARGGQRSPDRKDWRAPLTADLSIDGRELFVGDGFLVRRVCVADGRSLDECGDDAFWFGVVDPALGMSLDGRRLKVWRLDELEPVRDLLIDREVNGAVLGRQRTRLALVVNRRLDVFQLLDGSER